MLEDGVGGGGVGAAGGEGEDSGDGASHVGRGWRDIDRQMRRVAARRAALDAEEARLLIEARAAEIHRHLGLGSFGEYLERVLGYAPHTGRERMRVAEALAELPATTDALRKGHISYSVVREMSRVAKPHNEDKWLSYVDGLTVREVEDAVRGLETGADPGTRPNPDLEPRVVRLELPPATYALFLDARRYLEKVCGSSITNAELIAMACRTVLAGSEGDVASDDPAGDRREARDESGPASVSAWNAPPHQIAIIICEGCKRGWHDAPGRSIELTPSEIERARCDAVELGRVDETAAMSERASRTIPAHMRRAVLARDHHRCRVPGCTMSRYVDVHHIIPWSEGGPHTLENLLTLCELHHTHHHEGRIRIAGTAGALVVTYPDGRPYRELPPPSPVRSPTPLPETEPPPTAPVMDVKKALVRLGFPPRLAADAVEQATLQLEPDVPIERLIVAALRHATTARAE